jgi:hypothetical protein
MYKLFVFAFLILVFFSSCEKEPIDEVIPFTFVNIDINLDLIQYQSLRNPGGYVYLDQAEASSGYRGIIVYHEGSGSYRAFERACTFDPHGDCDPVTIDDSGLFMIHNCCKSTFNFNGNPTGGPASLDLLEYDTYLDGIYLKIRNG